MSMNFSEFKKLLGADPLNRDPEILRARASGPEFEKAARQAEIFEASLESAARFAVDADALVEGILAARDEQKRGHSWQRTGWLALAASVVLVSGMVVYMWDGLVQPDTVEAYVQQHYGHDGEKMLAKAGAPVDAAEVSRIMAKWGMEATPELAGRVTFIKRCITMDGMGAHMIVQTDQGPVNLIVMPKTPVNDRQLVQFGEMQAHLVSLGSASAAIIGRNDQSVSGLDQLVRRTIFKST
jgi:hypothetical protein